MFTIHIRTLWLLSISRYCKLLLKPRQVHNKQHQFYRGVSGVTPRAQNIRALMGSHGVGWNPVFPRGFTNGFHGAQRSRALSKENGQLLVDMNAHESDCFRLTNMTAPAVQDPRSEMRLHCRFDMGGEELYAVKWYKDDHEFFRYTPSGEEMVQFPVHGVHVDAGGSTCSRNSCDLLLKDIKRPQSSGAYMCEVSSEAPAFRLASDTRSVTVAALPDDPPVIEGLKNTYSLGDILVATCTSSPGDPKPILTFYINKEPVSKGLIRDLSLDSVYYDHSNKFNLKKSKIQIRMNLDRKISGLNTYPAEISCVSTTEGISALAAPPLSTNRTFSVIDHNQIVNNQKFRWADPTSSTISKSYSKALIFILYMSAMFNYLRLH